MQANYKARPQKFQNFFQHFLPNKNSKKIFSSFENSQDLRINSKNWQLMKANSGINWERLELLCLEVMANCAGQQAVCKSRMLKLNLQSAAA